MPENETETLSEEEKNVRFMRDPNEWPMWPVLPMKARYGVGFLYGDPPEFHGKDDKLVVHLAVSPTFRPESADCKTHSHMEYRDIQAAVDAGWKVD